MVLRTFSSLVLSLVSTLVAVFASVAVLTGLLFTSSLVSAVEPSSAADAATTPSVTLKPALRRPMALALSADEAWLMVLNQRAGTMSLVDMADRTTKYETPLGKKPADLVLSSDRKWMLIPDETAHELLIVDWIAAGDKRAAASGASDSSSTASADARPQLRVRERVAVSPYPVSVSLSRDERRCFVASLWSRRLTEIELPTGDRPAKIVRVIDLPLAPRKLALVRDDSKLIVNDAFGGRLVVVDTASGKLDGTVREFPAHNIRGISVTPDGNTLVLAHQMLNELAHTIRNDVHWGLLMSNDLRWLKVDKILEGGKDLFAGGHMHPLGHAGSATADPAGVAFAPNGKVFVALSGVGEVAIGNENDFSLNRVASGKRPVAITVTKDSKQALVANMFGDSVSVIDVENYEKSHEIPLGPPGELTLVDRGELLFYDGGLSHDGWMSCHSCHTDGHTNGQLNDNFSDKSFGAPKRVLSLLGRADTAPFAWNGSSATLPEQIRKSLTITMQMNKEPSEKQLEALSAYVASLESPPSIDKLRGTFDEKAVERGRGLFTKEGCVNCHAPPTFTTPKTYDVGLKDQQGNREFNPPSLRGVGQRAPYFHDNSAASLEEVFRKHNHQLTRDLSDAELADLVSFLRSL